MNEILNRVDEIILRLKNSKEIKRMYELKEDINSNEEVQGLIEKLEISDINLSSTKIRLYNYPTVKEYLSIQNELDYIIMHFNSRLLSLISINECKNKR